MGAPAGESVERRNPTRRPHARTKGAACRRRPARPCALLLLGSLTVADALPLLGKLPSANVVISNMKGPPSSSTRRCAAGG